MSDQTIFLLSPAHCGGKRAAMLFNDRAAFDLARRVREPGGAPLADVFSFLSGLYFRGKVAYARAFSSPPRGLAGAHAITSTRGLVPIDTPITLDELRAFGTVDIHADDARYRKPLEMATRDLAQAAGENCTFVLLGSIATGKYVDVLLDVLGPRLCFPREFVGRGDMSRGGLMLRCADAGEELEYVPVSGAVRRGTRPPKLQRRAKPAGG